jgi:hypothetical protein
MKYSIILSIIFFLLIVSNVCAIKVNLTELIDHETRESDSSVCDASNVFYVGALNITGQSGHGYWKFNNSLPSDITINDAKLYLNLYSGYVDDYWMNLTISEVYNQTWECVTWDDEPCNNASQCDSGYESNFIGFGKFDTTLPYRVYYNWSVTNAIKNEYTQNNQNISFIMKNMILDTNWEFYSMEYGTTYYRPYLEVDYSPLLAPDQIDFSKFNYIKQYGQILHNHNICVDNETLGHNITYTIKIDLNQSIVNVWVNEPCTFGCDNVTMSCRASQISEYSNYFIYLIIIVIAIGVIYALYKRW